MEFICRQLVALKRDIRMIKNAVVKDECNFSVALPINTFEELNELNTKINEEGKKYSKQLVFHTTVVYVAVKKK